MRPCLVCMGGPQPDAAPEANLNKCQVAEKINSLDLLFMFTFNSDCYSAFTAIRMPCWEIFILLPTGIAVPFIAARFLAQPSTLLTSLHGGFISWCRTWHLKFFNLLKFPLAYFSSFLWPLWTAALPSRLSAAPSPPPYEISPGTWLRVCSLLSSRLLTKTWNIIVPWHLRRNTTSFRLQTVLSFEQFSQFFTHFVVHLASPVWL